MANRFISLRDATPAVWACFTVEPSLYEAEYGRPKIAKTRVVKWAVTADDGRAVGLVIGSERGLTIAEDCPNFLGYEFAHRSRHVRLSSGQ